MSSQNDPGSGHLPEHRASDADRELVAADLREAFGEGRLTAEEYQERLDAVWTARTFGELAPITADLPEPRQRANAEQALAKKQEDDAAWYDEWRGWAGASVLMVGIWGITSVASGGLLFFWPMFPIGIWGLMLVASMIWGEDEDPEKDDENDDER